MSTVNNVATESVKIIFSGPSVGQSVRQSPCQAPGAILRLRNQKADGLSEASLDPFKTIHKQAKKNVQSIM